MDSIPSTVFGTMARLWPVMRPLLEAADARRVLEIGVDQGHLTSLLIAYCEEKGGFLRSVDPKPAFHPHELQKEHKESFLFLAIGSVKALDPAPMLDAAVIDGDHNHHTVLAELRLLRASPHGFPLVLLHDVGWPYARRDLYYDPAAVPDEARHAHAPVGLFPDGTTAQDGGHNAGMEHATHEGGPRNGVLTAVEDFLAETPGMRFLALPGIHGLGVLVPEQTLASKPALAALLDELTPAPAAETHLRCVEEDRLRSVLIAEDRRRMADTLREENTRLRRDLGKAVYERDAQIAHAERLASHAARMERSLSWRLTSPLRAVMARARKLRPKG